MYTVLEEALPSRVDASYVVILKELMEVLGEDATVSVRSIAIYRDQDAFSTVIDVTQLTVPLENLAAVLVKAHDQQGFGVSFRSDHDGCQVVINHFPIAELDWMRTVPSVALKTVVKKLS